MTNLIRLWKERNKIAEGIANSVFKKEHVEEIAHQREIICKMCEFYDTKGTHCAIPGTQPCCAACGCSLGFKLRSLSSDCPKGLWQAEVSHAEEEDIKKQISDGDNI